MKKLALIKMILGPLFVSLYFILLWQIFYRIIQNLVPSETLRSGLSFFFSLFLIVFTIGFINYCIETDKDKK